MRQTMPTDVMAALQKQDEEEVKKKSRLPPTSNETLGPDFANAISKNCQLNLNIESRKMQQPQSILH
jgi:hypothetical protein